MQQTLQDNAIPFRLAAFLVILLLMLLWEALAPRRTPTSGSYRRLNNLTLLGIDVLFMRYLLPLTMVSVAEFTSQHNWGLYHLLGTNFWLSLISFIIFMDLLIYTQHLLMHKLPWLWRLHRVHHSDLQLDVTTALRFHPLEILLSALLKCLFVTLLGPPVIAVILFAVILNTLAMFNHSNIHIPIWADHWLRHFFVTPDMHRVHHSVALSEQNRNYGFNLSCWDHIFSTYKAQPAIDHQQMQIGLKEIQGTRATALHWLLIQPFLKRKPIVSKADSLDP